MTKEQSVIKIWVIVVIVAFVVVTFIASIRTVQPGFEGVVVRLGKAQDQALSEGLHFVIPYITSVKMIDTRIQRSEIRGNEAASKDLQIVTSTMVINFHLEKDKVVTLYRQIGVGYENIVISPGIQECFKAITADYTAENLITQRSEVSEKIRQLLSTRLLVYGIVIDQVNVTNFEFSSEFNKAIEQKVTMEQRALTAVNELKEVEAKAKQTEATAKGKAAAIMETAKAEAESLELRSKAATPIVAFLNLVEK